MMGSAPSVSSARCEHSSVAVFPAVLHRGCAVRNLSQLIPICWSRGGGASHTRSTLPVEKGFVCCVGI